MILAQHRNELWEAESLEEGVSVAAEKRDFEGSRPPSAYETLDYEQPALHRTSYHPLDTSRPASVFSHSGGWGPVPVPSYDSSRPYPFHSMGEPRYPALNPFVNPSQNLAGDYQAIGMNTSPSGPPSNRAPAGEDVSSSILEESIKRMVVSRSAAGMTKRTVRLELESELGVDLASRKEELNEMIETIVGEYKRLVAESLLTSTAQYGRR